MSILSGWLKTRAYRKTTDGYKKESRDTSSETVFMNDGNTAETNLGAIKGITRSLATDNDNFALSASAGKELQDKVTDLNTNLSNIGIISTSQNEAKSVASGVTDVEICRITLPIGVWLIIYGATFQASINAGYRRISTNKTIGVRQAYVPNGYNVLNAVSVLEVTKPDTLILYATQSSGSSIDVIGYIDLVRIK